MIEFASIIAITNTLSLSGGISLVARENRDFKLDEILHCQRNTMVVIKLSADVQFGDDVRRRPKGFVYKLLMEHQTRLSKDCNC